VHRVLVLAVVVLFGTHAPVHAASFDCAAAKSSVEKLICSDPALSDLDGRLGQAFQAARGPLDPKGREWLTKVQRSWLNARLGWCGIPAAGAEGKTSDAAKGCLAQLYRDRLAAYQSGAFGGPPNVERIVNGCNEPTKPKRASNQSSQVASAQAEQQECLEKAIQDQLSVLVPSTDAKSARERDTRRQIKRSLEQLKAGYQGLMWTLHTDNLGCKEGSCGPETRLIPGDLYADFLVQFLQRVVDKRNEAGL
jgi:uncharacterized protein YecT (DUF1311 family)